MIVSERPSFRADRKGGAFLSSPSSKAGMGEVNGDSQGTREDAARIRSITVTIKQDLCQGKKSHFGTI